MVKGRKKINLFDLTGKKVIVTGGTGHLGKAMCEALACYGANVIVISQDKEKNKKFINRLKNKYNCDCRGYDLDLSSSQDTKKVFQQILDNEGKIDVLVNNANYGIQKDILNFSEEEWKEGIDGTINNCFMCTKAVLPKMIEQRSGNIINIASMYGIVSPNPNVYEETEFDNPANYGAGKAAIIQFTKYLASYYGEYSIRANAISPGPFPNYQVQENSKFIDKLSEKNPLGRIGYPEELQGIIIYLASSSSSFVTGQNISVDGGWTIW
ncbi:SDR family oxidoreductase [Salibacterium sp. K-3]